MGSESMCHIACSTVCCRSRQGPALIPSAACTFSLWLLFEIYIFFSAKLLSLSAFKEIFENTWKPEVQFMHCNKGQNLKICLLKIQLNKKRHSQELMLNSPDENDWVADLIGNMKEMLTFTTAQALNFSVPTCEAATCCVHCSCQWPPSQDGSQSAPCLSISLEEALKKKLLMGHPKFA